MIWSSAYRQWEMLDMGYEENTVLLQCNHLDVVILYLRHRNLQIE